MSHSREPLAECEPAHGGREPANDRWRPPLCDGPSEHHRATILAEVGALFGGLSSVRGGLSSKDELLADDSLDDHLIHHDAEETNPGAGAWLSGGAL